mmetsp:Transcript_43237/g.136524  ORF Transcript_43237/g.136524 Transcript_43237/m.136524 type:complete len:663 (-) Transcript_43237:710-2698(-)
MCSVAETGDDTFFWEYLECEPPDPSAQQADLSRLPAPPFPHDSTPHAEQQALASQAVEHQNHSLAADIVCLVGLSLQEAIRMQDMLIEEYRKTEFQDRLHEAWSAAGGNVCEELKARQSVCLPVQCPIIARFGFEPTRRGVHHSVQAFKSHNSHPEVEDRNMTMQYLVNPPQQNAKWINGFEEPPRWWQRAQCCKAVKQSQQDVGGRCDDGCIATVSDAKHECVLAPNRIDDTLLEPKHVPESLGPQSLCPQSTTQLPSRICTQQRRSAASIDDAIDQLSRLQIMLAVPSVSHIRASRPLRRFDDEIYVAQFVLQSTSRNFSRFLSSEQGKAQFHPFLKPSDATSGDEGSFGWLDDKTRVIYQTNGIARTEETIVNTPIRCDRSGAPGHYIETKMLVARRRGRGVAGQYDSGMKAARSFLTRQDVENNLFYSFTSCWQIFACTAFAGELGESDAGERILIRRSIRDFTQHHFHDFPVAKHLAELLDGENATLIDAFAYDPCNEVARSLLQYQSFSLRAWQTYEFESRPPEEDFGFRLVSAARIGHVGELKRLVLDGGCDCDSVISEFGIFGTGRSGCFTRSELGFAEERTALIGAVEAGWLSVVELIVGFAKEGRANLNVVCHEWNPRGCVLRVSKPTSTRRRWGRAPWQLHSVGHGADLPP